LRVSPLNNFAPWRRPPPSKTTPPGVIEEDAPSDYFYLIVEGKVDIYREEKHLILESLSTGAVFGLLSIIDTNLARRRLKPASLQF
jgi:CRP-like cAMP-binding protein